MALGVVRLICPNLRCRAILSVPGSVRGMMVRCSQCGSRIKVPSNTKPRPNVEATPAGGSQDGPSS